MKGADVLCHLPEKEDEGSGGNDLSTEDSGDDKGKDKKHVGCVVGGDGGDGSGSGDAVVVNDSGTFMHKPCGLKGLAVQTRVHQIGDPIMFNAVPSLPLTSASFCILQGYLVHS